MNTQKILKTLRNASFALLLITPLAACSIEQTEEGELPDVNVDVEPGNLPKYDVDAAEIEVGTETKTVEVPDVDVEVGTKEVAVKVPDVDINMPGEEDDEDPPNS